MMKKQEYNVSMRGLVWERGKGLRFEVWGSKFNVRRSGNNFKR